MITFPKNKLRVCAGKVGEAQSLSAEAVGRICDGDMKPVRIERFPRKSFERTAVIARCGIRLRAARPERKLREQCAMTASPERESKVFELRSEKPQRGSRNEEVQCLCETGDFTISTRFE
jgi:hypothetical protein